MNILEKLAYGTGNLIHQFMNGLEGTKPIQRPKAYGRILHGTAETYRFNPSDYSQDAAQKRALLSSWVYSAIYMKAKELSASEFQIVEFSDKENADPIIIKNHPLIKLMRSPNPIMGRAFFWQYTSIWLDLSGNAYWFTVVDEYGRPIELWPLPSNAVEVYPGNDEKLIEYYEYNANGTLYQIPAELIIHIKYPNPFDLFRGLSPLAAAMLAVDTDLSMSMWNGSLFNRDNVMPSAIINLKPLDPSIPIPEEEIEAIKEDLRNEYSASKRKTAILTAAEMQIEKLEWSPIDIDFRGGREAAMKEIYLIYGIPPGMLDSSAMLGSMRLSDVIFKEKTIWPTLVLIAEQLTTQMVHRFYDKTQEAQFKDIRPVNRQLELQEMQAASPYLEIDEIRETYFNRKPLANGRGKRLNSEAPPKMTEAPIRNSIVGEVEGQPSLAQQGLPTSKLEKISGKPNPPDYLDLVTGKAHAQR